MEVLKAMLIYSKNFILREKRKKKMKNRIFFVLESNLQLYN